MRTLTILALIVSAGTALAQDAAGITRSLPKQKVLLHSASTRFPMIVIGETVRAHEGAWSKKSEVYTIRPDRLECETPGKRMVISQDMSGSMSIDCVD